MAAQLIIVENPGKEIMKMRKNMGWTQEELAAKAGIGIVTINRVETEKIIPDNTTLKKIFDVFCGKYKLKYAIEDRDADLTTVFIKKKKRF